MKKLTTLLLSIVLINSTDLHTINEPQEKTSIFDSAIAAGFYNQKSGLERILSTREIQSELPRYYDEVSSEQATYQTALGLTKMIYGTAQIATGSACKVACDNPMNSAVLIASIIIQNQS